MDWISVVTFLLWFLMVGVFVGMLVIPEVLHRRRVRKLRDRADDLDRAYERNFRKAEEAAKIAERDYVVDPWRDSE